MSKEPNKMKLRTDGIYVQFGYRPWNSWLGYADDCWYNLLKAIDDENLIGFLFLKLMKKIMNH